MVQKYNIGEFIEEFVKFGKPSLEILMSSCPQTQPRMYSIASSPLKNRHQLELAIANVLFGKGRHGLCTHFLHEMNPQTVSMLVKRGVFLYPKDFGSPIIMACLGAGIAPMLGLLQHREYARNTEKQLGKAILYFGARNKEGYVEFEKILNSYKEKGVLDEYHIAYSRDGPNKVYITDLMNRDVDSLWEYWGDDRAEFFYCGPPRGIPNTLYGIMDKVVAQERKVSIEQANKLNKKQIKSQNQFLFQVLKFHTNKLRKNKREKLEKSNNQERKYINKLKKTNRKLKKHSNKIKILNFLIFQ